jgi:tetratricopeptide (TPR) repeat protein
MKERYYRQDPYGGKVGNFDFSGDLVNNDYGAAGGFEEDSFDSEEPSDLANWGDPWSLQKTNQLNTLLTLYNKHLTHAPTDNAPADDAVATGSAVEVYHNMIRLKYPYSPFLPPNLDLDENMKRFSIFLGHYGLSYQKLLSLNKLSSADIAAIADIADTADVTNAPEHDKTDYNSPSNVYTLIHKHFSTTHAVFNSLDLPFHALGLNQTINTMMLTSSLAMLDVDKLCIAHGSLCEGIDYSHAALQALIESAKRFEEYSGVHYSEGLREVLSFELAYYSSTKEFGKALVAVDELLGREKDAGGAGGAGGAGDGRLLHGLLHDKCVLEYNLKLPNSLKSCEDALKLSGDRDGNRDANRDGNDIKTLFQIALIKASYGNTKDSIAMYKSIYDQLILKGGPNERDDRDVRDDRYVRDDRDDRDDQVYWDMLVKTTIQLTSLLKHNNQFSLVKDSFKYLTHTISLLLKSVSNSPSNNRPLIDNNSCVLFKELGLVHIKLENFDQARVSFEKGRQYCPNYYHRGGSHGDGDEGDGSLWDIAIGYTYTLVKDYNSGYDLFTKAFNNFNNYNNSPTDATDGGVLEELLSVNSVLKPKLEGAFKLPKQLEKFNQLNHRDHHNHHDHHDQMWLVKRKDSAEQYGTTVLSSDDVVGHVSDKTEEYIVTKFIDNPVLYNNKKSDLNIPVAVMGYWPLSRVYVNGESSNVRIAEEVYDNWNNGATNDNWNDWNNESKKREKVFTRPSDVTFKDWGVSLLTETDLDEEVENMEVELTVEGAPATNKNMLSVVRKNNFENLWMSTVREIGGIFGKANAKHVRKHVKDGWKSLYTSAMQRTTASLYSVDVIVTLGGDYNMGLLNPAKHHITEIHNTAPPSSNPTRVKELMQILAGSWSDRTELELIRNKYKEVSDVSKPLLSQRLSWAVQGVTEKLCPEMFKKQTEMNKAREDIPKDFDWSVYECDQQKVGLYSMELVVATFEYQRKGGWELAYPLNEDNAVGVTDTGDQLEKDARMLRNMFVRWIVKHEEERRVVGEKRRAKAKKSLN